MIISSDFDLNKETINGILNTSPFREWLGIRAILEKNQLCFYMPFAEHYIENLMIRATHGGVMVNFLECTTSAVLSQAIDSSTLLRALNSNVVFLRSTSDRDSYADVKLLRHGRRLAILEVKAWQDDENHPVALGRFNFLLEK